MAQYSDGPKNLINCYLVMTKNNVMLFNDKEFKKDTNTFYRCYINYEISFTQVHIAPLHS